MALNSTFLNLIGIISKSTVSAYKWLSEVDIEVDKYTCYIMATIQKTHTVRKFHWGKGCRRQQGESTLKFEQYSTTIWIFITFIDNKLANILDNRC